MQRIITLIYVLTTAAVAGDLAVFHTRPVSFLIDLFSTDYGEKYYIMPVFLITWLVLLIPLFIFLLIAKRIRKKKNENIAPDRTGIFVTRKKSLQSALIGIPVYINGKKAGMVDNEETRFFDMPSGTFAIQAGKGRFASEILQATIEGNQLHFEIEILEEGFRIKYILRQV